ncbi:MAG: DUF4382 domain-containing protein [Thermoplasmatota archaeon]
MALLIAGCMASSTGTFTLHATDAPDDIGDFSSLTAHVSAILLTPQGGSAASYTPANSTFDLTKLTGSNTTTLFHGSVPTGTYSRIEISISNVTGVLKVTGTTVSVVAPSGTIFVQNTFNVSSGAETTFTFDIQVHKEGNGQYILKPNAGGSHA